MENMDLETFESTYELSEVSRWDVKQLAKKLRKSKRPSIVIFASCYNFQSEIRELLIANGILASLNISKDRGTVSEGKMFALDKQQQEIIDTIVEVNSEISFVLRRILIRHLYFRKFLKDFNVFFFGVQVVQENHFCSFKLLELC